MEIYKRGDTVLFTNGLIKENGIVMSSTNYILNNTDNPKVLVYYHVTVLPFYRNLLVRDCNIIDLTPLILLEIKFKSNEYISYDDYLTTTSPELNHFITI